MYLLPTHFFICKFHNSSCITHFFIHSCLSACDYTRFVFYSNDTLFILTALNDHSTVVQ